MNLNTLEEKKEALIKLWNKIPVSLCERLCNSFDERINQVYESRGGRLKLNPVRLIREYRQSVNFTRKWNEVDEIEKVPLVPAPKHFY